MTRIQWRARMPTHSTLVVTIAVCALAYLVGLLIYFFRAGPKEIVIVALASWLGVFVLVPSERVLKVGLLFWILTFGLGWRTLHWGDIVTIHPAEVLVWIIFLGLLARMALRGANYDISLPTAVTLFDLLSVRHDYGTRALPVHSRSNSTEQSFCECHSVSLCCEMVDHESARVGTRGQAGYPCHFLCELPGID